MQQIAKIAAVFFLGHVVYQAFNMWVGKAGIHNILFGVQFSNFITFASTASIIFAPLLICADIAFASGFYFGISSGLPIWTILAILNALQLVVSIVFAAILLGEYPDEISFIGMLFTMVGLLICLIQR